MGRCRATPWSGPSMSTSAGYATSLGRRPIVRATSRRCGAPDIAPSREPPREMRRTSWRPRGIAARISLLAILVTAVALGIMAIGVLGVAQSTFNRLMVEAGQSAATAKTMFDHSVVTVFTVAVLVAAVVSVLLASLLALRLARPLDEIARAARRVAQGEYQARVQRQGPEEVASLADSVNQMAESLQEQEQMRREFIVNAAHELSTPLTNLQGYLEALRDGVIAPSAEQFQSLHEEVDRLVRLSQSLNTMAQDTAASTGRTP